MPFNSSGDAVSVWPPWGSLLYGLGYVIGGESALYLINPLFSLLSIAVSGLLAWELMRNESPTRRGIGICLTCFLIATSNEIVNWAGVTMVDTQALVFSTLAFYCMLRVYRTGRWAWAISAGLFWGLAYLVRHTQLVLVLGLLPLVLADVPRRARVINLLCMSLTALIVALPDLWYHQTYLGGWLTPESEELGLYSLGAVASSVEVAWQSAFIGAEFGWLLLALVAGMALFTRRERIPSAGLLLWLFAVLAVHLPYAALRLRDLIPEFPVLAFYSSYGVVASVGLLWQSRSRWASLAAAIVIFLALELAVTRVWNTLPRVVQDPPARFGAMTAAQRVALDELRRLTPENALIGASLNSGAIELYARRSTFRPAGWCGAAGCPELREFLDVTGVRGNEIYLLEDDAALGPVLENLAQDYQLEKVTTLDVPLFGDAQIPNAGTLWRLSR